MSESMIKKAELGAIQKNTLRTIENMQAVLVTHPTGTGKTRIGVGWKPTLIVAPAFLLPLWEKETGQSIPVFSYHALARRLQGVSPFTREMAAVRREAGFTLHTERLLMDEAHILRNDHNITWIFSNRLKADRLLMLTATPMSTDIDQYVRLCDLAKRITGSSLIRIHAEPRLALPPVKIYWHDGIAFADPEVPPQIPAPLYAPYPARLYHIKLIMEQAKKLVDWERVIVFTRTRRMAEDVALRFMGTAITGEIPPLKRMKTIERWRISNERVLAATWDSIGIGVDIPEADLMIFTEVPQTPMILLQAIGRARRIQRDDPVIVAIYAPPIRRVLRARSRLNSRLFQLSFTLKKIETRRKKDDE